MAASPTAANMLPDALRSALDRAQAQVNGLVLGKPQEVRLAFVALLANGHVLIEDPVSYTHLTLPTTERV